MKTHDAARRTRLHRALDVVLDRKVAHDAQGSGARLTQINKEYNRLSAQQSKLGAKLIEEGHGHVRHSELAATGSPTALEYLRLSSELNRLRLEGERIYGPDFRPGHSTYYRPKTIRAKDSTPGSGKTTANARHALFNAGKAAQQSNFRSAVFWYRKAEELFLEAGLTRDAELAAGKAMEAESYAGKKDVDRGGAK